MSTRSVVIRQGKPGKGALAKEAAKVTKAGRYGDDMLVHINASEYAMLKQAFGDPTINPDTGLPEFFLSALIPAAVTSLTGLGGTVGNLASSFIPGMSSNVAGMLGNALVGAGVGAMTNKNAGRGALYGALGGTLAPMALNAAFPTMGFGSGDALSNLLGGFMGGGAGGPQMVPVAGGGGQTVPLPPQRPAGLGNALAGATGGGMGGISGNHILGALALAGALGGGSKPKAPALPPEEDAERRRILADNARPLQEVSNVRFRAPTPAANPLRYAIEGGEREFYEDNRLPETRRAMGGHVPANGVHGRQDSIRARLAGDEYILDAETVSMLGNGSPKAGALALDAMRENIRKHKGEKMAKGALSALAKKPEAYMKGAR